MVGLLFVTQSKLYHAELKIHFTCCAGYVSQLMTCQHTSECGNCEQVSKLHTGGVMDRVSDNKTGQMNGLADNNQVL